MRLLGFILAFGLAASVSYARLGETEPGLIELFGQPTSRGQEMASVEGRSIEIGTTLSFRQEDWRISCVIIDDRCAKVTYTKTGSWTEEQFRTTLNVNAQGLKWTETTRPKMEKLARSWKRDDGALAEWVVTGGITFTHPAYDRAKATAAAKGKAAVSKVPKL